MHEESDEPWVIEPADPLGAAALTLLREAALEARALYPELFAPDAPMPTNEPLRPGAEFFIASHGARAVGCAALRPIDAHTAEVRRMYVLRDARRGGVAGALLQCLEAEALELGYDTLRLETGQRQQPAMALYEAHGFRRIAAFGPYAGDPTSVCFEKRLAGPERVP